MTPFWLADPLSPVQGPGIDERAGVPGRYLPGMAHQDPATIVARMQADLTVAMKARDRAAVTALRTGMAAIANAEAPPAATASAAVAGQLVEHARLELTSADVDRILRHEIDDRRDTIATIEQHDRIEEADALRSEIGVLERYIS